MRTVEIFLMSMSSPSSQNIDQLKASALLSRSASISSIHSVPSTRRSSKPPPGTPGTPTQRNLSSFAPWDREQFVGRLGSFKDVFWSQLPGELCELEWARRGWVERKDRKKGVTCGLCQASVEVIWNWEKLRDAILRERESKEAESEEQVAEANGTENSTSDTPTPKQSETSILVDDVYSTSSTDADSTSLLLKHYKPLLSSGHTTKCPWVSRSADPTILRLPPQQLTLASLTTRLTTLSQVLPFLPPSERLTSPKPLPITLPASLASYDERLLQAGIAGWSGAKLGQKGILTCSTCHRRVGLWLFTSESESMLRMDEEPLDLLAEHKKYCPWVNAMTQTGLAAWEYMYKLLEPRGVGKRDREDDSDGKESRFKRLREMLKGVGSKK